MAKKNNDDSPKSLVKCIQDEMDKAKDSFDITPTRWSIKPEIMRRANKNYCLSWMKSRLLYANLCYLFDEERKTTAQIWQEFLGSEKDAAKFGVTRDDMIDLFNEMKEKYYPYYCYVEKDYLKSIFLYNDLTWENFHLATKPDYANYNYKKGPKTDAPLEYAIDAKTGKPWCLNPTPEMVFVRLLSWRRAKHMKRMLGLQRPDGQEAAAQLPPEWDDGGYWILDDEEISMTSVFHLYYGDASRSNILWP